MPQINVYVSDAMAEQLRTHPGINRSKLLAEALARYFEHECTCAHHRKERGERTLAKPAR